MRWHAVHTFGIDLINHTIVSRGHLGRAPTAAARAIVHAVGGVGFALATLEMARGSSPHPELARQIFATLHHARFISLLDCEDSAAVAALPQ